MAKMQRTKEFLDCHIRRVWEALQEARKNDQPTESWEKILDNLLDQRLAVVAFSQTASALPEGRED